MLKNNKNQKGVKLERFECLKSQMSILGEIKSVFSKEIKRSFGEI